MEYRNLTKTEVSQLVASGCTCEDWNKVLVNWEADQSFTKNISSAHFSGEIRLGTFSGEFLLQGGIPVHCGISNASLHNVTLGNNCIVRNVHDYIANYTIGDCCLIDDVDLIYTDGESSFGNGTEASVLNEAGGMEVVITDILSSQAAYLMAKGGPAAEKLRELSHAYAASTASDRGVFGTMVTVRGAGTLCNVCLGDHACVSGAARLENGTVNSSEQAPAKVGQGVMAEDFVFSCGSVVENGAALTKCFVGQATHVGRYFSAVDSLFFSNCHFENGEACALFAGPYTVSHHKATLLIAGLFSFSNAGSASNQSNHMYKTGPVHWGELGRGTNLASGSHVLWPLQTAPFTMIMGRHKHHSDTSLLPFSFLIENLGTSYLAPAVNLLKAGTARDFAKWPKRDHRKGDNLLDCINFNQFSPYTAQLMLSGIETLEALAKEPAQEGLAAGPASECPAYRYKGTVITVKSLKRGIEYYKIGLAKYLGGVYAENREALAAAKANAEPWRDLSGLLAPCSQIDALLEGLADGTIATLGQFNSEVQALHGRYHELELQWVAAKIGEFFGDASEEEILKSYDEACETIRLSVIDDATKDVILAGGDPDKNSFISSLKK